MGMGGGGGSGHAMSEINVTPMIDVLLVLLIIFMVIVPVTPKGLNTLIPQPPKNHEDTPDNSRTIVVVPSPPCDAEKSTTFLAMPGSALSSD